jgi:hypothetical protein
MDRIKFAFNYYRKFLDMDVGKGTELENHLFSEGSRVLADEMYRHSLKKPWSSYCQTQHPASK